MAPLRRQIPLKTDLLNPRTHYSCIVHVKAFFFLPIIYSEKHPLAVIKCSSAHRILHLHLEFTLFSVVLKSSEGSSNVIRNVNAINSV